MLVPEQKCCGMPMMANANLKGAREEFPVQHEVALCRRVLAGL